MMIRSMLCCVALLAYATTAGAASPSEKPRAVKASAKKSAKPAAAKAVKPAKARTATTKVAVKGAPKKPARTAAKAHTPSHAGGLVKTSLKTAPAHTAPVLRGKTEVLTCRDGTEDRHARIALVLVGGKTDAFAYYSKWKPRTCSIYLQRNRDPQSKWSDSGVVTNVNTDRGVFLIEHKKNEYRLVFRDIDRERYCGMDGTINGTLTIRKGSERCEISGIMEEGTPLGQAYAHLEQGTAVQSDAPSRSAASAAPASSASVASESRKPGFFARFFGRQQQQSSIPAAAPGLSD